MKRQKSNYFQHSKNIHFAIICVCARSFTAPAAVAAFAVVVGVIFFFFADLYVQPLNSIALMCLNKFTIYTF